MVFTPNDCIGIWGRKFGSDPFLLSLNIVMTM